MADDRTAWIDSGQMALAAGTRLGSYEILAPIGAGGMGEVYRARDPRLGRDVAIKVLPRPFAADADRLARFTREARATAALNHPNIVTIHSVEQAGDVHFLTMELVEGTPLTDRIPRDGLPLDRLLAIAIPLADAVGTAHAAGIVHRDLKPGNVMVTADGRVKVLDFGLAKLRPLGGISELTTAPPLTVTDEGHLLGTVAYMSPEQAEGREVDHRSDIFSLGVVLYELATGRRPFTGGSSLSVLSAILKDTPASITDVRPEMPRELARIVRRCLAKDPERRYQSAKDARNELEELRQEVVSGARVPSARAAPGPSRRFRSFVWIAGGIAALATIAFVYLAWRGAIGLGAPSAVPSLASRIEIVVPLPESVKAVQNLSVSPDSTRLAFTGAGQLWIYDLATRSVSPVKGTVGAPQQPFWSPDGAFIAYFQVGKPGMLMKIPATGGIPAKICDLGGLPRGGAWGAENTIVLAQVKDGVFRVSADGGVPRPITKLVDEEGGHMWPQFLPDGRHFTYMTFEGLSKVYVASLDPIESRRLVAPAPGAPTGVNSRAFALSGFLLTAEGGTLRARSLSSTGMDPAGEPELLAQDVQTSSTVAGDRLFAASPAVIAYGVAKPRRSQFSFVDRWGRELRVVGPPVLLNSLLTGRAPWSLSPNGRTLAFTQMADDRSSQILLLDLIRSAPDRFTFGPHAVTMPLWNQSGDQIVFWQGTPGGSNFIIKRIGSEGESDLRILSPFFKVPHDWNGNTLLFAMHAPNGSHNFWHLAIDGSRKPELWFPSQANHVAAQFSPDGQWVAYSSDETDAYQVYLRRFPAGDRQVMISNTGGTRPRWRPDGKAVFYVQGDALMEVDLDIGETAKSGEPRQLLTLGESCGYAVLPDSKRFVLCRPIDPVLPPTITVVVNWAAGLERR